MPKVATRLNHKRPHIVDDIIHVHHACSALITISINTEKPNELI